MIIPKTRHILIEKSRPAEMWFFDLISCGLTFKDDIKDSPNSIFLFDTEGSLLFQYNKKTNIFWCMSDRIWFVVANKFNINLNDINDILSPMIEKYFKIKPEKLGMLVQIQECEKKHFKLSDEKNTMVKKIHILGLILRFFKNTIFLH